MMAAAAAQMPYMQNPMMPYMMPGQGMMQMP